ncbi:MAG: hypothetical protein ACYSTN_09260 [Planctomycetota bacterium]|jgi:hypothetical protein
MNRRKLLKFVHFAGTAWLMLSAAYVLILAMRQAGQSWWFIISISGYSALLAMSFISLYLFAFFRGFGLQRQPWLPVNDCVWLFMDHFFGMDSNRPDIGAGGDATALKP